jgi:hypothetical protein
MVDRDRVRNPASFLNDGFFTFLDEDFVDYSHHLSDVGLIKRAAAVARVCRGVKLENIVGRGEAADNFLFQEFRGELRNYYRRYRGNDSSVCDGVLTREPCRSEPGKCIDFSLRTRLASPSVMPVIGRPVILSTAKS